MRILLAVLFFISFSPVPQSRAQTPEIERLKTIVEKSNGKEKISALIDLSAKFSSVDPRKGIDYGEQALHLADSMKIPFLKSKVFNCIGMYYFALSNKIAAKENFTKAYNNAVIFEDSLEMAIALNRLGVVNESNGNFDSSLICFKKALEIYKQLKRPDKTGTMLENIGTIHLHRGESKSALNCFVDAKNIYEETKNIIGQSSIYLKLGRIYAELKDYDEAEKWYQKSINLSLSQNDFQNAAIGLNALGILYKSQAEYEKALAKYKEALGLNRSGLNKNLTQAIYDNIGNVYSMQGKYQDALYYHRKSSGLLIKFNNPLSLAINQVNMGNDYTGLKDFKNAKISYEKALPAFRDSKSYANLITTYKALIDVNNSLDDFKESVKYYQLYTQLKDSLDKRELNKTLDSLRIKFRTEEIDHENTVLTQKTEIQNKTISQQRTLMVSSFIFIVLMASLALVIIKSRQKIKKANALLESKNLEISNKAEELLTMNEKLRELSNFKDSMNSFLVHDLKNPLNTIINIGNLNHSGNQIETIKQSGKQMLNLVMNILDISKYENKTMKISTEDISVTQIINKAYNDIQYLAEKKSIRLMINYSTDFIVSVDPEIIERVFVNIFSNAIKFSKNGENIQVFAEELNQTHVKIIITDHGEGIDNDFLPMIFDKYTQTNERKLGITPSTGIGLTFCKMAIEAHSCEIGADSVVGQGSSFWFTLPLTQSDKELKINPVVIKEKFKKIPEWQLTKEEIELLIPFCNALKKLSIYQISDVKDIVNTIDLQKSAGFTAWKSDLLQALSDCNGIKYNELINFKYDGEV